MYQRIILDTKLSDFLGLNVTTYHERIIPALRAAHNANSLSITFGGKLLANHAGPADPGFNNLLSLYTAKMHTLNTTESQYVETLVQLPLLEQVFRNSEEWEATHKNKGGAYVAEGLQQTAARDLLKVQCYGRKKMGHYRSDCPQEQNSSKSDTASTKKKKKKFIKWREVAPASGSPTTMTKDEKTKRRIIGALSAKTGEDFGAPRTPLKLTLDRGPARLRMLPQQPPPR